MNPSERRLLFEISEADSMSYAELSMRTRMSNEFLNFALDSLVRRGFIERDNNRYRLAAGVQQFILNTVGSAVNS